MGSWEPPPSFGEYVRGRHRALRRFARVLCGDPYLADDLVQEALVAAALRWKRIERRDQPEAYLRRAIVNLYLNNRRKLRRESLVGDLPELAPVAGPEPLDSDVWRLLATLPRQQRAVLVLRYYEDLSEVDIAAALDCSVGTVKSNASRAMAKLRAALGADVEGGRR